MAGRYDITADQGATLRQVIVWRMPPTAAQIAAGEPGTPVDLTGYSARMHARESVESETTVLELTTENNRIRLGVPATTGEIELLVDAATMEDVPAGGFVYDLELVDAAGFVTRLIGGKLKVTAEVTRQL